MFLQRARGANYISSVWKRVRFFHFFSLMLLWQCVFLCKIKRMFYFAFRRLAESTDTLKKENAIIKSELGEWSSYNLQSVFIVDQSVLFSFERHDLMVSAVEYSRSRSLGPSASVGRCHYFVFLRMTYRWPQKKYYVKIAAFLRGESGNSPIHFMLRKSDYWKQFTIFLRSVILSLNRRQWILKIIVNLNLKHH